MIAIRHAPATLRNRGPILAVLKRVLPSAGLLLEIASGTGEHAAYMAPQLPGWTWQPTDEDADALRSIDAHTEGSGCSRIRPAIRLDVRTPEWSVAAADAILCCNMIHIAPWNAAEGLFAGASRLLVPMGLLILYGPFKRNGTHTAPSNAQFDAGLRAQNPEWGVRCLDGEVEPLAAAQGFAISQIIEMPANNLTVVFRKP